MPAATKTDIKYAVTAWYMEHNDTSKNSHKFYQVFLFETGVVVLRWGRIGTLGQTSITKYPDYESAQDIAYRQVYAKKSKGYVSQYDDMKFLVEEPVVNGLGTSDVGPLVASLNKSMEDSKFAGARDAVLQHYVSFSDQAQRLLHRAPTADLAETMADYEALEDVWEDILTKHNEVQIVMDLAKTTLTQKLMGGES